MNAGFPIYTSQNECQDCYKCVRHCTVKAIKIESGRAAVVPELCISCGHCVRVCPAKAKHIRNDLPRVRAMLESGRPVFLSLAPSYVSEFAGWPVLSLIGSLRGIGFAGVSETALGAEMVNSALANHLKRPTVPRLTISTACPSVVEYINKYIPRLVPFLADMPSPVLAHAGFLRARIPSESFIVFAGPCVAKKREADAHPELLDAAITFSDVRSMLQEAGRDQNSAAPVMPEDRFFPHAAREGRLYPVPHGMIGSLEHFPGLEDVEFISMSGIAELEETLRTCNPDQLARPVFIEALACPGGCMNGPGCVRSTAGLTGRLEVMNQVKRNAPPTIAPEPPAFLPLTGGAVLPPSHTEEQVLEALRRVGKRDSADELNCGGCGYNTCREFARALLDGRAEPNMCLSWLRRQTQKKANALLK
ncbi:MAG TPA: [Fe-Fe] hydrogenase large subunit C-terminal domain-containing protein, partial [Candidatus Ozemobacteraceae bacterium]|nr:[Fe-Fe] hydrogenase large subunit C-terminal domain-containing protein [Candidatus Ozemobacteraceae bacterium]